MSKPTIVYTPELTSAILIAINGIVMSNNGYCDIGTDENVAKAISTAGFTVLKTKDLHGNPVYRAFTKEAQAALKVSPFGVVVH